MFEIGTKKVTAIKLSSMEYYSARLPVEYQEVEYIQAVGAQRIDTGVYAGNNIQTETKIGVETTELNHPIFGCSNGGGNYYHCTPYNNKWYVGINNSENNGGAYSNVIGTIYTIVFNNNDSYLNVDNGNVVSVSGTQGQSGTTLQIAGRYDGSVWLYGIYKYYYFKMYDKVSGEYVRDFVPCFRKSDGEPGMYDLVTNTFFTNAGSGRFLIGRDIGYLPSGYQQVEYVLNTTGAEYIDLGIVSNSSLKMSFMVTPTYLNTDNGYIGGIWSASDFLLTTYQGKFRMHNGGNYIDTATATVNTLYDIWINNAGITINGTRYSLSAGGSYGSHNLWLYLIDGQASSTIPRFKTYGLRIWNQGEFVRDYVPCIRESDGAVGFYDLVNDTFHANQGGGSFAC